MAGVAGGRFGRIWAEGGRVGGVALPEEVCRCVVYAGHLGEDKASAAEFAALVLVLVILGSVGGGDAGRRAGMVGRKLR